MITTATYNRVKWFKHKKSVKGSSKSGKLDGESRGDDFRRMCEKHLDKGTYVIRISLRKEGA